MMLFLEGGLEKPFKMRKMHTWGPAGMQLGSSSTEMRLALVLAQPASFCFLFLSREPSVLANTGVIEQMSVGPTQHEVGGASNQPLEQDFLVTFKQRLKEE